MEERFIDCCMFTARVKSVLRSQQIESPYYHPKK